MWLVYRKELLELARDKKTLIFTILLPTLILPVLMFGFGYFSMKMALKNRSEILKFAVIGQAYAPDLVHQFAVAKGFKQLAAIEPAKVTQSIRDNKLSFVLEIPQNFLKTSTSLAPTSIILHYNSAGVSKVKIRVSKVLEKYNRILRTSQLSRLNLTQIQLDTLLQPVTLKGVSIAKDREKFGAVGGGLLAYMLLIIVLAGATYPALDLGVGEKERQTLETLLLNPVPRWHLVLAKFFVIYTTGFVAVFLALLSMGVWSVLLAQGLAIKAITEILAAVGPSDIAMLMLMLVPAAALFAAVLLSISIYARNFKEAQNYITPLMFVVIIPVMVAMVPGVKLDWGTAMIPLTNIALAMREIVKGTMDYSMIGAIFLSTSLLAAGAVVFCSNWFSRETVLFRS